MKSRVNEQKECSESVDGEERVEKMHCPKGREQRESREIAEREQRKSRKRESKERAMRE